MREDVRAVIQQAIAEADRIAVIASERARREAMRVRQAGLSKQQVLADPKMREAGGELQRASAFAEGVRSLANRLLVEVLGEQPVPHPKERTPPDPDPQEGT
jgi:hypothetical protein